MNFLSKFLITLLLVLSCLHSNAQYTDVINSNRPGASQSAFSVGVNVIQLELGGYSISESRKPQPAFDVEGIGLDFSLHYGFFNESFEINVRGNFQKDTKTYPNSLSTSFDRSNFKNLSAGIKYMIYDPNKNKEDKPNLYSYHANFGLKWKDLIPAISAIVAVNYNTKNNPFTAPGIKGMSYRTALITQNNFNGGWVFITNFILDHIGADQTDFHYILSLTHSFNPKWVAFAETQGIKSDFYADNLFRLGAGYLINKNLQIDTNITFNTKDTPAVQIIGLGASYRLDRHKDKIKIEPANTSIN